MIPQKELRNNIGEVLRRAEAGEELDDHGFGAAGGGAWDRSRSPNLDPWVRARSCRPLESPSLLIRHGCATSRKASAEGSSIRGTTCRREGAARHVGVDRGRMTRHRGYEEAISAVSICELHYGLLTAETTPRALVRAARLGDAAKHRFPAPLPIDDRVAREWARSSKQPSSAAAARSTAATTLDLAIAATANVQWGCLAHPQPRRTSRSSKTS